MSSVSILAGRNNFTALWIGFAILSAAPVAAYRSETEANPAQDIVCTAKNAKAVSFRYIEKYSMDRELECIKVSGFVYRGAIYRTQKAALSNDEIDWQAAGLWREGSPQEEQPDFTPANPKKAVIIGTLRDCGASNTPNYCHYIGGAIINVRSVRFGKIR
jgi:hypothetical protein